MSAERMDQDAQAAMDRGRAKAQWVVSLNRALKDGDFPAELVELVTSIAKMSVLRDNMGACFLEKTQESGEPLAILLSNHALDEFCSNWEDGQLAQVRLVADAMRLDSSRRTDLMPYLMVAMRGDEESLEEVKKLVEEERAKTLPNFGDFRVLFQPNA